MQVITLNQIKSYLGIIDTTQDAAITAVLPALDAKVKEITRRSWNLQLRANIDGTEYVEVRSFGSDPFAGAYTENTRSVGIDWVADDIHDYLSAGVEVEGDGIPADTYVEEVYSVRVRTGGRLYTAPLVKLNNAATAWKSIDITFGFNRAYHPVVAKLAWWMVNDISQDTPAGSIASKSLGDISVSYSTAGADLDGRFGVPQFAVRGLPRYGRGY